jgi:hypothetical protein
MKSINEKTCKSSNHHLSKMINLMSDRNKSPNTKLSNIKDTKYKWPKSKTTKRSATKWIEEGQNDRGKEEILLTE